MLSHQFISSDNLYLLPYLSQDLGWGNRKRSFPLQPVPTGLYAPKLLHPPSYDVTSGSLPPEQRVLMTSDPLTLPPVLPYPHGFTNMSSVATACLSNREPGSTGPQYSWEVQQCQCQECLHQGALRLTAAPSTHATVPKHEDFSSDFLANLVRAAQMSRVDTSHVLSMLMPSTQQPANSPGLPADGSQTTPGHVMISPNWQDPPTGSSSSQGSSQGSLWVITHRVSIGAGNGLVPKRQAFTSRSWKWNRRRNLEKFGHFVC